MANQTKTLKTQVVNHFGPSPSTKWGGTFHWTAAGVGPGNGTWGLKSASTQGSQPLIFSFFKNALTNSSMSVGITCPVALSQAYLVIQDLTYTAITPGTGGNSITIQYVFFATGVAVQVVGQAIIVGFRSGTTTASQIQSAIQASSAASALISVIISGTGSNNQTQPVAATNLAGGGIVSTPGFTKKVNKLHAHSVSLTYANSDKEQSDGRGYTYIYPGPVTNIETENNTSYTSQVAASTTYTSLTASITTWT